MIQAICPASCGELLQGYIYGGEKLISYGIDLFSKVNLMENKTKEKKIIPNRYKKAYRIMKEVFKYYDYCEKDYENIVIKIDSKIPIAKGMASSTADLVATALATATYLNKDITEMEIARLCINIEPTDSTVFSKLTLFDHLKGDFIKEYDNLPDCKVLLLEGKEKIDTIDFRKTDHTELLIKNKDIMKKSLEHFEKGIKNRDLKEIGMSSTLSALANQKILYKSGLEDMVEISEKLGAYGVNVGHSGSVIGILFNDKNMDIEKFKYEINKKKYIDNYISFSIYNIVPGGGKIIKA